jgi:hypothetical protein
LRCGGADVGAGVGQVLIPFAVPSMAAGTWTHTVPSVRVIAVGSPTVRQMVAAVTVSGGQGEDAGGVESAESTNG